MGTGRRVLAAWLLLLLITIFAVLEDLGSTAAADDSNITAVSAVPSSVNGGVTTLSSLPPRLAEREKAHLSGVLRAVKKGKHMSRRDKINVLAHVFQILAVFAAMFLFGWTVAAGSDARRPAAISRALEQAAEEARGLVDDDTESKTEHGSVAMPPAEAPAAAFESPSAPEAPAHAPEAPAHAPGAPARDLSAPEAPAHGVTNDATTRIFLEEVKLKADCGSHEYATAKTPADSIASASALAESALARARTLLSEGGEQPLHKSHGSNWTPRLELDDDEDGEVC